jgi:cell division initiation protein
MSLSPLDISKHEFSRTMRGYDQAEVRAFLERVAEELAELQRGNAALIEQRQSNEASLKAYSDLEQNLRDALVASQENSKNAREQIERERQNTLREASLKAEEMKFKAEKDVMAIHEELRALKLHRDAYVKRLRFLLKSQNELVELIEKESPELPDDQS